MARPARAESPVELPPEQPPLQRIAPYLVILSFAIVVMTDSMTEVGIATGMLYAVPVALTVAIGRPWWPIIAGAVASALSVVTFFFKPEGYADVAVPNRLLMQMIVWITALLTEYQVRTEGKLLVGNRAIRSTINSVGFATLDGRVMDVNDSFLKMWGYKDKSEVVGRRITDFYAEERAAKTSLEATVKDGSWSGELVAKRKDGSKFDAVVQRVVIRQFGRPLHVMASMIDVSDLKKAEARAVASERKYRDLVEIANIIMIRLDATGRIAFFNRFAQEFFGYTQEEVVGKLPADTVVPKDEESLSSFRDMVKTLKEQKGTPTYHENERIKKDGSRAWIAWSNRGEFDENGNFLGILAVGMDITEQKRALEELRVSDKRMIQFLESMPMGKLVLDSSGRPYYANARARELLGRTADPKIPVDRVSKEYGLCVAGTDIAYPTAKMPIVRALSGETSVVEDMEIVRGDARKRIRMTAAPILDSSRKIIYSVGVFEDITERKQMEETIIELNEGLRRRSADLEAAYAELEAFSYSVSHDLRAPLRTIDGFSHAALEDYGDRLDETGRDFLNRVRVATQQMGTLIDDMLRLSRITRQELHPEDVDLSQIAVRVGETLDRQDPIRKVTWAIAKGMKARCDPRLVEVVLTNLIGNAWKFSKNTTEARIEVGSSVQGKETVYFVRDNGAGFDMKYANKLFGVFQRLHSVEEFEGTGIGLATVMRIIKKHGGRVWAEGEVGKGATFYFTL